MKELCPLLKQHTFAFSVMSRPQRRIVVLSDAEKSMLLPMLTRLNIGVGGGEPGGEPGGEQGESLKRTRDDVPLTPPQEAKVQQCIQAEKETLSPNVGRIIATLDIEDQVKFKQVFLNVYSGKATQHVVILDKHGRITAADDPLRKGEFEVGQETGEGAFNTVHHVLTTSDVLKKDAAEEWILRVNKEPGNINGIISECFWLLFMLKHKMTVDVKLIVVKELKLHVVMVKGKSLTTVSSETTDSAQANKYVEATVDRFNSMGDLKVLYMDAKTQNMVVYLEKLFFIDFDGGYMFKYDDTQRNLCVCLQWVIFVSHSCINKRDRGEQLSVYDNKIATYFNKQGYKPTLYEFQMLTSNVFKSNVLKVYLAFLIQYYFDERHKVAMVTFNSVEFTFPSREVYIQLMNPTEEEEQDILWGSFPENLRTVLVESMKSQPFWAHCAQQCTMCVVENMRTILDEDTGLGT